MKEKKISSPAPALSRGIQIIRFLEDRQSASLETISARLNLPKASALRFLETLAHEKIVERNPISKHYTLRYRFLALGSGRRDLFSRLPGELARLAEQTGLTAEWHVKSGLNMILIARQEPSAVAVRVVARIGFVFPLKGELNPVTLLGLLADGMPAKIGNGFFESRGAVKKSLSTGETSARFAKALAEGWAEDPFANDNGVRRIAVNVSEAGRFEGVLALAHGNSAFKGSLAPLFLPPLLQARSNLIS